LHIEQDLERRYTLAQAGAFHYSLIEPALLLRDVPPYSDHPSFMDNKTLEIVVTKHCLPVSEQWQVSDTNDTSSKVLTNIPRVQS
jgi:hypothetical protein